MSDLDEPSLTSELRRGFNGYNLSVGFGASALLGALTYASIGSGWLPLEVNPGAAAGAVGAVGFVSITVLHAALHAYFGWRFARGIEAHRRGRDEQAVRLLGIVARPGMAHYDLAGHATRALGASRARIMLPSRTPPARESRAAGAPGE